MKKLLSLSALAVLSAATFTGCVSKIGVDNPVGDNNASWNNFITGTLVTNYPGKTLEDVFKAASLGVEKYGATRVLEHKPDPRKDAPKTQPYYEVIARTVGDIKIDIIISIAKDPKNKTEWTQVSVQYGTWGNIKESQKIVSFISQNL
ncbi:MAG: DUF3568 family protein [Puniceicoccales bacterium]|nr:DUF3568 family protein [Puniceicoccales bacterium]